MIKDIASQFSADDGERAGILRQKRKCAAITMPQMLSVDGQSPDDSMPEKYVDIGTRGVSGLTGSMLMNLFPLDYPFFGIDLDARIEYDPAVPAEVKQSLYNEFAIRELAAQAILESAALNPSDNESRRRRGFRSGKRRVLSQLLVIGDTLEHMGDDYRLRNFRFDKYVTRRDDSGDVVYHITKESKDLLEVDAKTLEKLGTNLADLESKDICNRTRDLFTAIEWNPNSKRWVCRQTIGNVEVRVKEEHEISPYFSTCFDLYEGEHYGRSLIEANIGDLSSVNEIRKRTLDLAELITRVVPVVDPNDTIKLEDLCKPSGVPILGRVVNGIPTSVGFLQANKLGDLQGTQMVAKEIQLQLAKALLLEQDTQPRGDRVTKEQIVRVAQDTDNALYGLQTPISEDQQLPLVQRLMYQLVRDRVFRPLPKGMTKLRVVTGLAALQRAQRLNRVFSVVSLITQLGPDAMSRIDQGVLVDLIVRYSSIHEPGLVKTKDQIAAEAKAAMQQQIQAAAAQQAVQTTGAVAETAATALLQGQ